MAPEELSAEVDEVCRAVCQLSKPVLALGKSFFALQTSQVHSHPPPPERPQNRNPLPFPQDQKTAYQLGATIMTENLRFRDAQEGIAAFAEKRRPDWTHSNDTVH